MNSGESWATFGRSRTAAVEDQVDLRVGDHPLPALCRLVEHRTPSTSQFSLNRSSASRNAMSGRRQPERRRCGPGRGRPRAAPSAPSGRSEAARSTRGRLGRLSRATIGLDVNPASRAAATARSAAVIVGPQTRSLVVGGDDEREVGASTSPSSAARQTSSTTTCSANALGALAEHPLAERQRRRRARQGRPARHAARPRTRRVVPRPAPARRRGAQHLAGPADQGADDRDAGDRDLEQLAGDAVPARGVEPGVGLDERDSEMCP